jgi:ABC-type transport system involved in Fe-S cluster assembly fused permease/ATPase subunit
MRVAKALGSLINYETVKYFCNSDWEQQRCDTTLAIWENKRSAEQTPSVNAPP